MPKPQIKMGTAITNYHQVRFAPNVMLSSHATVCGNVKIGAGTSVFAGTQIRGDCEPIVIGEGTNIQENACLHVSVGSSMTIGKNVTIGHNVQFGIGTDVATNVHFGNNILVAGGVRFVGRQDHSFDVPGQTIWKGGRGVNAPIEIEDDVWIGAGSVILSGVKIARGAIVAAGSVVTKDVPPCEIWGGNPARKIRDRFPDEADRQKHLAFLSE